MIEINKKDLLTIILRMSICLIVGMFFIDAAFSDDEEEKHGTDNH